MDHLEYLSSSTESRSTSNGSDNQTLSDSFNSLTFNSASNSGSNFSDHCARDYDTQDFVNGMIFVCDESTTVDMFKHQIFGLPIPYLREMKMLIPGRSALFLIEKQTSLIRGVFVPTCQAKKNINDKIWLRKDQCSYPSQIKFELHSSFPALPKDSDLTPAFLRRMKIKGKYLDRHRVSQVIRALQQNKTQQSGLFNRNYPNAQNPMMNPMGMFQQNSLFSPPSPHNGHSVSPPSPHNGYSQPPNDYMNGNYMQSRPNPTSGLTQEQQMFIERYIKEKRMLNKSCNQMSFPPVSPTMNMPMMQNHNDMFMQNMMKMCADWSAFSNNGGHRGPDKFEGL